MRHSGLIVCREKAASSLPNGAACAQDRDHSHLLDRIDELLDHLYHLFAYEVNRPWSG
jgi:hypothetical protein